MAVQWISTDTKNTLAHISEIELNGKKASFPQHALTYNDFETFEKTGNENKIPPQSINIAAEALSYSVFHDVGHDAEATDVLLKRLKTKLMGGRINFVYPRIPNRVTINDAEITIREIDDLQASAMVGIQLDLNPDVIIPPIPNEIQQKMMFDRILERTINEKKLFGSDTELLGLIPKTNTLDLIPLIVNDYVKAGVRHFAMDFSGATLPRANLRTAVRAIRESLKIRWDNKIPEDKQYTFHIFNAASSIKSPSAVTPITDLLTHAYGVDTTSGVIWGGGKLVKEKLRYYNTNDYGAYRLDSAEKLGIKLPSKIESANATVAYKHLRVNRIVSYAKECTAVSERVANEQDEKGYAAYLLNKEKATERVNAVLMDIREIRAQ